MNAERYLTREKAEVEVYGRSGQIVAHLRNLSKTGACLEWFENSTEVNKGDLIRMTVNLKNIGRSHQVNAEVVWREGNKSGVNFIKSEEVLDRLMAQNI